MDITFAAGDKVVSKSGTAYVVVEDYGDGRILCKNETARDGRGEWKALKAGSLRKAEA